MDGIVVEGREDRTGGSTAAAASEADPDDDAASADDAPVPKDFHYHSDGGDGEE